MGKVLLDISLLLDGFIAAPNDDPERPLGDGGQRLHDWVFGGKTERTENTPRNSAVDPRNAEVLDEMFNTTGAMVAGRRTYDFSKDEWGERDPFGGQLPVFVLSHDVPERVAKGGAVYTFVTDGIESALTQAKSAAGDKNVQVMGGANIAQQCLKAGLLDEIQIHLVPVLLGEGRRLFEHLGTEQIELETTRVIESPGVTHLKFRVVK
jgi:dihydrofolate reductase